MASRRTRIKGIANIPPRKKNTAPAEHPPDSLTTVKDEEIAQPEDPIKSECEDEHVPADTEKLPNKAEESNNLPDPTPVEPETEKLPTTEDTNPKEPTKPLIRRKCIKPVINPNVIKQRVLPKETEVINHTDEAPNVEESKVMVEPPTTPTNIIIHNDVVILKSPITSKVACDITKQICEASPAENQPVLNEENVSQVVFRNPDFLGSDTEYPGPPASPSKYNRSRIKPIPKLSLRKPSASESEDEGRKYYGRIRNNSVCSAVSVSNQEPQTPLSEEMFQKEPASPKKLFRTEQSRKLAEARREFYRKFGTNNPDKQKLKMIDLIYYNPTSNPMSTNSSQPTNNNDNVDNLPEPPEVEANNDNESDNESALVPQIKIGPSGEIVLDEKSLVVENTQVIKQKEQIQNSKLIDGDSAGYGIYKRSPRATSWTQEETLHFYKALNVIGTDFTLMTQLFPKRNRRELKTKFKKEERSNLALVDKALKERCSYNFQDLKREMEIYQAEKTELQQVQERERQKDQDKFSKRSKTLPTTEQANLPFKKRQSSLQSNEEQPPQKKARKKRKRKLDIKSVIDDDESVADVSDFAQSDSECDFEEEEFIPYLKATRSGRMPKSTLQFNEPLVPIPQRQVKKPAPTKPVIITPRSRTVSTTSSVESATDSLIPGSVVITSEETEEGKSHYKAFMVTPQKKLTPIELESSVIDCLVKEGRNVTLPLGEGSDMVERNVTIVESEVESVHPRNENENNVEIITEL